MAVAPKGKGGFWNGIPELLWMPEDFGESQKGDQL